VGVLEGTAGTLVVSLSTGTAEDSVLSTGRAEVVSVGVSTGVSTGVSMGVSTGGVEMTVV